MLSDDDELRPDTVIETEICDELDLHTFHPREVKDLVATYLNECVARGFTEVRIVHGKGQGTLRRIVHSVLEKHPSVESFFWCATSAWRVGGYSRHTKTAVEY